MITILSFFAIKAIIFFCLKASHNIKCILENGFGHSSCFQTYTVDMDICAFLSDPPTYMSHFLIYRPIVSRTIYSNSNFLFIAQLTGEHPKSTQINTINRSNGNFHVPASRLRLQLKGCNRKYHRRYSFVSLVVKCSIYFRLYLNWSKILTGQKN